MANISSVEETLSDTHTGAEHEFLRERCAREQAEAAIKARDYFLAAASHELRTPLTAVLLLAQMLERNTSISEELRDDARTIRENVEIARRLVSDLVDVSAIRAGKPSLCVCETSLHDALCAAIAVCRPGIERKRLRLEVGRDARRDRLVGDPDRLRQIFWNLIENSVKFTPDGGWIRIRTSNDGRKRVLVEIADSGTGIDAAAVERVFDPFVQGSREPARCAKGSEAGLGLGLAIAQVLAQAHGGTITVASDGQGRGATFTVCLPVLR